jgi:hypothetical protein
VSGCRAAAMPSCPTGRALGGRPKRAVACVIPAFGQSVALASQNNSTLRDGIEAPIAKTLPLFVRELFDGSFGENPCYPT